MLRTILSSLFLLGCVGLLTPLAAQDKETKKEAKKETKKDKEPAEKRGGTVTGIVTDKGDNFIEVKADGEEKGRRYFPHWRGGAPAEGGGLDKAMVKQIKDVPLKSRVRIEWTFEERPRVEKIDVLKRGDGKETDKPKEKDRPKEKDNR
jgi:hypothetical protein